MTTTIPDAAAPSTSRYIKTSGTITVPDGEVGKLSVVTIGRPDDGSVPVIVRNRTSNQLNDLKISGTARDAGGKLIGSGESQEVVPSLIEPGEWAFGYVYFGTDALPSGATFDLTATASKEAGSVGGSIDLVPTEVNVVPGDFGPKIVGVVTNDHKEEAQSPISVTVICFTGGKPTSTSGGFTDGDGAPAGGTASFSIDVTKACSTWAIGSSGYTF